MTDPSNAKSVCIDGYNISMPRGSGIATYGRSLLHSLQHLGMTTQVLFGPAAKPGRNDVVNETSLIEPETPTRKLRKSTRYVKTVLGPLGRQAIPVPVTCEVVWPERTGGRPAAQSYWSAQNLFWLANRTFDVYGNFTPVSFGGGSPAPDVMHWTATVPLTARGVANVYTIHDLIPLKLPHATQDDRQAYFRMCKRIAAKADHIVAVSETTRQDVIRILGVEETRVTNTYQTSAIPQALIDRPRDEVILELERIFDLGWKGYFLYFGAIEPKKNLGRIVEAYLASGVQSPLIVVGGRAWLSESETALMTQVQRDGGPSAKLIRQYEFLPQSLLVSLIRGAKATLFPSLYEGFGLPVLESMLLDTAVLTSNSGALQEVAGDAAVSVDPYDVRSIARGICALDADDDLRAELVAKGARQREMFSPKAYQERLGTLYRDIGVR